MNKTIIAISRFGPLRATFRGMRLHKVYNKWLEHFPRTRVFPESGVTYRARRTEGVSLALEMLEGGNCYEASLMPKNCSTFADLGCNVGFFACWLAHHSRNKIRGLMVDANPDVLAEARWHAQANHWDGVHVLQGVVGVNGREGSADFLVHEADTVSTAELVDIQLAGKHKFKKITAPVIAIGKEWEQRMGKERCQLLKIDVEGSEMVFLRQETQFLELVDAIFIEWHKYRVTFEELDQFMTAHGFKLVKILEEIGFNGTAVYKRG